MSDKLEKPYVVEFRNSFTELAEKILADVQKISNGKTNRTADKRIRLALRELKNEIYPAFRDASLADLHADEATEAAE